jgi:MarR family transcriptional regulator, organic hydroperoxide resistance regulator
VRVTTRKSDARRTDVYLTYRGRAAVARVRNVASRIYKMAFHDFSAAEIDALNRLLRRTYRNLGLGI